MLVKKNPNATRNFSRIHGANEFTIIPQPIFVHCGIELINGLSIPYRGICLVLDFVSCQFEPPMASGGHRRNSRCRIIDLG